MSCFRLLRKGWTTYFSVLFFNQALLTTERQWVKSYNPWWVCKVCVYYFSSFWDRHVFLNSQWAVGRDISHLVKVEKLNGILYIFVIEDYNHENTYIWEKTQAVQPAGSVVTEFPSDYLLFVCPFCHLPMYAKVHLGRGHQRFKKTYLTISNSTFFLRIICVWH